jgi:hypothetical protein
MDYELMMASYGLLDWEEEAELDLDGSDIGIMICYDMILCWERTRTYPTFLGDITWLELE